MKTMNPALFWYVCFLIKTNIGRRKASAEHLWFPLSSLVVPSWVDVSYHDINDMLKGTKTLLFSIDFKTNPWLPFSLKQTKKQMMRWRFRTTPSRLDCLWLRIPEHNKKQTTHVGLLVVAWEKSDSKLFSCIIYACNDRMLLDVRCQECSHFICGICLVESISTSAIVDNRLPQLCEHMFDLSL